MTSNDILIPVIRATVPSLTAQQIVGVQPKAAHSWGRISSDYKIPYSVHPRYKFSRRWYIHRINHFRGAEVYKWCEQQFGPHPKNPDAWCRWYRYSIRQFYFRDEQDYAWFVLRWS